MILKVKKKHQIWFFDLDDTLHDASNGPLNKIDQMMNDEIQRLLLVNREKADELRLYYWKKYGATVIGLNKIHNVSSKSFLAATHSIKEKNISITPTLQLAETLKLLVGRKWIVTNSPRIYAIEILKRLKIKNYFEKIITIEKMSVNGLIKPKPHIIQWKKLVRLSGVSPKAITVVDDNLNNLKSAKQLGCRTVWAECYRKSGVLDNKYIKSHTYVDCRIKKISSLLRI